MATERGRERVHLLCNIVITAPVFHLDTSELNAAAPENTARREKGATKKRERPNPPHKNNNKKVPIQIRVHKNKNKKMCEKCDPMKLELS